MNSIYQKTLILSIFLLAGIINLQAGHNMKNKLRFNKDGLFNIVQITDTHIDFCDAPNTYQNKWKWTEDTYNELKDILVNLKKTVPGRHIDLVVFTGDIVTQMPDYINETPKFTGWTNVLPKLKQIWSGKDEKGNKVYEHGLIDLMNEKELITESKSVPWAFTMGNHDIEKYYTKENCAEYFNFLSDLENSISPKFNITENDELTPGNYLIPVYDSKNKKSAVLYFINTWDGGFTSIPETKGKTVVNWLKNNSSTYKYPSLLFMHIPDLWNNKKAVYKSLGSKLVYNPRIKVYNPKTKKSEDIGGSWSYNDLVSANENDGGLFYKTIVESGNIMGVLCGHDHYNHFNSFTKEGVAICYGLKTLSNWWANLGNGARLITLKEEQKQFTTSKFYYVDSESHGLSGKTEYDISNKTYTTLPSDDGNEIYWANKFYDKYFSTWSADRETVDSLSVQITNNTSETLSIGSKTIEPYTHEIFKYKDIIFNKVISLEIRESSKTLIGNLQFSTPIKVFEKVSSNKISVSKPGCYKGNREKGYMRGYDFNWSINKYYKININNTEIKTIKADKNQYEGYAEVIISKLSND